MSYVADILFDAKDGTGECPLWDDRANRLIWTDIPGRRMHVLDPSSGTHRTFTMPGRVGCFALRESGGFIIAMEQGFAFFDPDTGSLIPVAEPEAGIPNHRFNDGRCDRSGRFFAGSMNMARSGPTGQLWRLDRTLIPVPVAAGVVVANGLAFSPEGNTLYWSDSFAQKVVVFDYDSETGTLGESRLWLEEGSAPGRPDGAAVDAAGCYWSARWMGGCVVRFTPTGRVDRIVELPVSRVAMCAFGGTSLRTLFITTAREGMTEEELEREPLAGGVFAVDVGVQGLKETRFNG